MLQMIGTTAPYMASFVDLPRELRDHTYHTILREQGDSGAIVTISAVADGTAVENYQFPIPDEYKGFLLVNKLVYQEFKELAAKVYGTNDFANDAIDFSVKAICFHQQTLDLRDKFTVFRVNLLTGIGFTNRLRHAVLNAALRRIECRVKFIDRFGNTFPNKFSLSWSDDTAHKSRQRSPDGSEIWAKACAYIENQIRNTLHEIHINFHVGAVEKKLANHQQDLLPTIVANNYDYDPFDIEN